VGLIIFPSRNRHGISLLPFADWPLAFAAEVDRDGREAFVPQVRLLASSRGIAISLKM
jgi:hypothetical protein